MLQLIITLLPCKIDYQMEGTKIVHERNFRFFNYSCKKLCVINFRGFNHPWKFFNHANFPDYSTLGLKSGATLEAMILCFIDLIIMILLLIQKGRKGIVKKYLDKVKIVEPCDSITYI